MVDYLGSVVDRICPVRMHRVQWAVDSTGSRTHVEVAAAVAADAEAAVAAVAEVAEVAMLRILMTCSMSELVPDSVDAFSLVET